MSLWLFRHSGDCAWEAKFISSSENRSKWLKTPLLIRVVLNQTMDVEIEVEMDNCTIAPPFGHFVSRVPLAALCDSLHWGMERAQPLVQLTAVENSLAEMNAFYDQEPSWQHISFHSMLNNCRLSSGFVLCLSLVVGVWSWTETEGHFCILIYWDCFTGLVGLYFITVWFRLVRCWPLGMFYWTLCGKLKPKTLRLGSAGWQGTNWQTNLEWKGNAL